MVIMPSSLRTLLTAGRVCSHWVTASAFSCALMPLSSASFSSTPLCTSIRFFTCAEAFCWLTTVRVNTAERPSTSPSSSLVLADTRKRLVPSLEKLKVCFVENTLSPLISSPWSRLPSSYIMHTSLTGLLLASSSMILTLDGMRWSLGAMLTVIHSSLGVLV